MEHLVEKAMAGDKLAEKKIFSHLLVRFTYLAGRRVGKDHSEDLAQEACKTILEKYKTEKFSVSFAAWAYGVLRMKIGNYLSTKKRFSERQKSFDGVELFPEPAGINPNLVQMLIKCLRKIAKNHMNYARVLNFSYQGYDTGAICRKLNIKANYYYVILNRGRKMLDECLREGGAFE
jgi:DNA-directed RNA polymerase specialized sigma24 family protein